MRQFSYITSNTDNYSGKTSEESHIVNVKQNDISTVFFLLYQSVYPFSFVAIPVMVMGL